ncbi:MAG: aminoacetone oxidase family FAD-binding enzyme, partial [Oscillospiraceae bacterium]|nr:aminoacetone oxidase family FAD-binding enzyme [Oscillospiraceae bacterium]
RVFPISDKASDVAEALEAELERLKVTVIPKRVKQITRDPFMMITPKNSYGPFDKVIIATGGKSYPHTGSTGDGYKLAAPHNIITPRPVLVPIETEELYCRDLMGLTLKNVKLSVEQNIENNKKTVFEDLGELVFTHFGVSGPLVLSASVHINPDYPAKLYIDLKPGLTDEKLDERILEDFSSYKNKDFCNSLSKLLPKRLIHTTVRLSRIPHNKKVNEITKEERHQFRDLLKKFPMTFQNFRPIDEAIITAGGIDLKEINPQTMESKLIPGLHFAGEVVDLAAYTGGFNLQIAFSTAFAASFGCVTCRGR